MDVNDYLVTTQAQRDLWLSGIINSERTDRPTREDLICLFADFNYLVNTHEEPE
jgi:hypothetical protein